MLGFVYCTSVPRSTKGGAIESEGKRIAQHHQYAVYCDYHRGKKFFVFLKANLTYCIRFPGKRYSPRYKIHFPFTGFTSPGKLAYTLRVHLYAYERHSLCEARGMFLSSNVYGFLYIMNIKICFLFAHYARQISLRITKRYAKKILSENFPNPPIISKCARETSQKMSL